MPLHSTVFSQTITKNGHFNYADLYTFCINWFKSEGYFPIEVDYKEKGTGAREVLIHWAPEKEVTDYFKFVINVEIFILGLVPTEIERDGKKEKTNEGNLRMKIRAEVVKDYEERWEKKPMSKFMRGIYEQYIIRNTVDEYEERLVTEATNFSNEVKAFLELSR